VQQSVVRKTCGVVAGGGDESGIDFCVFEKLRREKSFHHYCPV
jgi:hypothetical protein